MTTGEGPTKSDVSFRKRLVRVVVSVVVLTGVTVVLGYGGWIVLTLTATIGGYDPKTADGDYSVIGYWHGPTATERSCVRTGELPSR